MNFQRIMFLAGNITGEGIGFFLFAYVLAACFPKRMKIKARNKAFNFAAVGAILNGLAAIGGLHSLSRTLGMPEDVLVASIPYTVIRVSLLYLCAAGLFAFLRFSVLKKPLNPWLSFGCPLIAAISFRVFLEPDLGTSGVIFALGAYFLDVKDKKLPAEPQSPEPLSQTRAG